MGGGTEQILTENPQSRKKVLEVHWENGCPMNSTDSGRSQRRTLVNNEMVSIYANNFLSRLLNADSVPQTANSWYEIYKNVKGSHAGTQNPQSKSENLPTHIHTPSRSGAHDPCLRAVKFRGPTHSNPQGHCCRQCLSSLPNFTHSCGSGIQKFCKI